MYMTSDTYPVADFNRKPAEHIKRLQDNKRPEVLTVNGEASVVMVDPESFVKLREEAELSRTLRQITEANAEHKTGHFQPLQQAFAELKAELYRKYPDANLQN